MLLRLWMLLSIVGLSWAYTRSVQTYKIIGGSLGQQVTSSALIWEQYYGESKQLRYAVESGKYVSESEVSPVDKALLVYSQLMTLSSRRVIQSTCAGPWSMESTRVATPSGTRTRPFAQWLCRTTWRHTTSLTCWLTREMAQSYRGRPGRSSDQLRWERSVLDWEDTWVTINWFINWIIY